MYKEQINNLYLEKDNLDKKKKIIIELFNDSLYKPMKIKELAVLLGIKKENREELAFVLDSLIEEGKIIKDEKSRYKKAVARQVSGILTVNNRGFGFVRSEESEEDIFIAKADQLDALSGDEVSVMITAVKSSGGRHSEGRVVSVIKRANREVVGLYQKNKNFGFVIPDNKRILKDIFIPKEFDKNAKNGQKVVVEVYNFGDKNRKKPEGKIKEILGNKGDTGVDILSIAKSYGLEEGFNEEVKKELGKLKFNIDDKERAKREDFTHKLTVTIDGEDAKDLDDAISLEFENGFWELGVHIADVSHYVKEKSVLDKEALKRGTSVYLIDRVIPMLPKELSNGICSLNVNEERLTLSCIMQIDNTGKVLSHKIVEGIIKVDYRMSYTEVNAILTDSDSELKEKYKECLDLFSNMKILSDKIRKDRQKRGSIDFDFPESKIILDKHGKVLSIKEYERNIATNIIEDFMLTANETVAQEYFWLELPFLYRVHDKPAEDKLKSLASFINNFGLNLRVKSDGIHPKEIQKLILSLEGKDYENLVSRIALRSMKKANYSTECIGHFGLAATYYTHFTSPIRRYPDLQIHRIIKENINGGLSEKRQEHYEKILSKVANVSSERERLAAEVEREVVKYKKCEYMYRFIGEEFTGIISMVTSFGFYVELENTVEGLVHIADLDDDYYTYIESRYELVGEKKGNVYSLGHRVKVRLIDADKLSKTIDFYCLGRVEDETDSK